MAEVVDKTEDAPTAQAASAAPVAEPTFDLNGKYRYKVDEKGRVSLPAKFRKVVSKDLVVTLSPEGDSLWVFESAGFNQWIIQVFKDRFGRYDSSDKRHVRMRSILKSRSEDVLVDSSGRIMLPAELRGKVDIDKDVVIVGNTGYFEIWDAKRFDEVGADDEELLDLLFH
ncbi:MAG TPA: division/cell wall cluster transcriptional repressor MraZ [Candidatus Aphodovivens avistercoris]|nr:division/cell wall cluster transcriptional repressor MraZ [Candidatus Aphodovivens avistercoris]